MSKELNLPVLYDALTWFERQQVRNLYTMLQNGFCAYCGNLLTDQPTPDVLKAHIPPDIFPVEFFKYPVHLQHDHNTGLTEGVVHSKCNAVLWVYHEK